MTRQSCHAKAKHSSHTLMSVTGGLFGVCGLCLKVGAPPPKCLLLRSDITNSKSRIFLTTLGGREVPGLYGPGVWSEKGLWIWAMLGD